MKNEKFFEKRHSVSYNDVVKACNSQKSMVKAAESIGVPYKTFIRVAKQLGCYSPNPSGKGTTRPGLGEIPLSEILEGRHPQYQSNKIRIRLLKDRIKEAKCEICGLDKWNGQKIPLTLDHIDGNNSNHVLSNLRILCPNCHHQTPTFSNRKRN